jgi:hypothetical protein
MVPGRIRRGIHLKATPIMASQNFNSTTPAAPAGATNVTFQADKQGNVSAYVGGSGSGGYITFDINGVPYGTFPIFINFEVEVNGTPV